MPTISLTLQALIRRIAASIGDDIHGVVTGGSTTTATMIGEPALLGANALQGAELTTISSTNVVQTSRITTHGVTTGVATLTVGTGSTVWSSPTNGDGYEVHRLNGRGYTRLQYINAVNAAIDSMADLDFSDLSNITLAIERGQSQTLGFRRDEYPMPAGFDWLWGVDFLNKRPMQLNGTAQLTAFRALGDAAARTQLGQGFQLQQEAMIQYIAVFMSVVGVPADNLTCVIESDAAGIPSGSAVTNGTSGTVASTALQARPRYVVFTFDPPVLLAANTQYHLTLRHGSGGTSASNYYTVGEDENNRYGYGDLSLYGGAAWTTVAGHDLIFSILPAGDLWAPIAKANWDYLPANSDQIKLRVLPHEGVPIRLRGGAAIAQVSAETDPIPDRPEYIEKFALSYLATGRAGRSLPDNYAQQMAAQTQGLNLLPPPRRPLPANSVRIR